MIRVLVNGARGRMGKQTCLAVEDDPDLELVAETDQGEDLYQAITLSKAQVVVDFTSAESGFANTQIIIKANACPVIGTSGFQIEQVNKLQSFAREMQIGGVIAPNFAIGAVLMMKFAQQAAKYLPEAEIIELHHENKTDSPSGTAIRTAEMISAARQTKPPVPPQESSVIPGARGAELNQVRIHSVRLPGHVAQQKVIFGGKAQTLTIEHNSIHRESFMPGVCLACKKVIGLKELYYGLENIL